MELIEKLKAIPQIKEGDDRLRLGVLRQPPLVACRLISEDLFQEAIALLEKPSGSAEECYNKVIKSLPQDLSAQEEALLIAGIEEAFKYMHDYAGHSDAVEFMQWTDLKGYNYKYGSLYSRYDNNNSGLTSQELYQAFLNREEKQK
jgi:hypothetical protein